MAPLRGLPQALGLNTIQSVNPTTNTITLQSKSDYWGGPYQFYGGQKIAPKIQTVVFKYVPDQTTRDNRLQNAAKIRASAGESTLRLPTLRRGGTEGSWSGTYLKTTVCIFGAIFCPRRTGKDLPSSRL